MDDFGRAEALDPGPLDGHQADVARSAAASCPEGAIELEEKTTS